MGQLTYSGPLRLGTVKEGSGANIGKVALTQTATIAFSNTTAKDLFILPANSQILSIAVHTTTAFNAATNNVLSFRIGTTVIAAVTGTAEPIAVGISTVVPVAAQVASYVNVGAADTTINGIFAGTGTAATTGAATVVIQYIQN